ncbi:MAG TPA: DNA-3-methyladenine glycosylase 2 [Cyclobacteriaceae bacterium]|nr:DNA-3-methyladenine glycosylase 2 [Cyclobacteriaceae bacterium]
MKFKIKTPPEFSYDYSLAFLERSSKEVMHVVSNRVVRKLIKVDNAHVLFSVSEGNGFLEVEIISNPSPATKVYVTNYVNEWFDLDTDLKPFYSLAKKDEVLRSIVKKFHGYRIMGQPDLFESLIWAVLGQQINVAFAYSIKQRFVEKYGERHEYEGHVYYLFPTPERVAQINPDELIPLQFSRQKSAYTIGIAKAFVENHVSRVMLHGRPLAEAKEELMKLKGIGNWTANYALMRTFRYPDAFPLEDVALHKALRIQMNMRKKPTLDRVKKIFKRYKGWEAYATLYLWKSL